MIPLLVMLMVYIMQNLHSKITHKEPLGIPEHPKRFTKTDSNGNVSINTGDIYEVIQYVKKVEDYFEDMEVRHEE